MSAKESAPGKLAPGTARRGALKRLDGEPLTRQDLQYDLLSYIFNNEQEVFTDPFSNPPGKQVTFRDLYVSAIMHAPKTARSVRDKVAESDTFATDFAMLSLLANVGRVNTSMAFFPETRTALRTYHPVPSLQRTDGNLTDAPRIRNALKSVILPSETKLAPNSPIAILAQRETGPIPTTSAVNLLFVLSHHSTSVGNSFLSEAKLEFIELFQPVPIPSAERGRVFLWLCFHYLESSDSPNPFADPPSSGSPNDNKSKSKKTPGPANQVPHMHRVDPSELASENVDTQEEKECGEQMSELRRQFLLSDKEKQDAVTAVASVATRENEGSIGERESGSGTPAPSGAAGAAFGKLIKPKGKSGRKMVETRGEKDALDGYATFRYETIHEPSHNLTRKGSLQLQPDGVLPLGPASHSSVSYRLDHEQEHYNRNITRRSDQHHDPVPASTSAYDNGGRGRKSKRGHAMRTEPYEFVHSPERTMFQQAWHQINARDVLYDSDEVGDEHVRLDLTRRLQVLDRLGARSLTPELVRESELDRDHPQAGFPATDVLPEQIHRMEMVHHEIASGEPRPAVSAMDVDDRW